MMRKNKDVLNCYKQIRWSYLKTKKELTAEDKEKIFQEFRNDNITLSMMASVEIHDGKIVVSDEFCRFADDILEPVFYFGESKKMAKKALKDWFSSYRIKENTLVVPWRYEEECYNYLQGCINEAIIMASYSISLEANDEASSENVAIYQRLLPESMEDKIQKMCDKEDLIYGFNAVVLKSNIQYKRLLPERKPTQWELHKIAGELKLAEKIDNLRTNIPKWQEFVGHLLRSQGYTCHWNEDLWVAKKGDETIQLSWLDPFCNEVRPLGMGNQIMSLLNYGYCWPIIEGTKMIDKLKPPYKYKSKE